MAMSYESLICWSWSRRRGSIRKSYNVISSSSSVACCSSAQAALRCLVRPAQVSCPYWRISLSLTSTALSWPRLLYAKMSVSSGVKTWKAPNCCVCCKPVLRVVLGPSALFSAPRAPAPVSIVSAGLFRCWEALIGAVGISLPKLQLSKVGSTAGARLTSSHPDTIGSKDPGSFRR